HPATADFMSSYRALDYLRHRDDAPVSPAEKGYALKAHGAGTRRRVDTLLCAVLLSRVDGIHLTADDWLDAAHR
ncbi:hypothetical protein, partial [Hymenobacter lapidiphilus]